MRKTLASVATALVLPCAAGAADIRNYETRVDVAPDGSAIATADVQLTAVQPGRLLLPVGFAVLEDFKPGEVPAGVVLTPRASKDQAQVEIEFPAGTPSESKIGFSFRIPALLFVPKPEEGQKSTFPAGSRLLRHGFVNVQAAPIARYRVQVRLPEGAVVHMIREQLPKPKRKEFLPRVELDRFDGRQGASLQFTGLRQGDRTSMELEVVDQRRSLGWLLVLAPLAVAYLFGFRDLVKREAG